MNRDVDGLSLSAERILLLALYALLSFCDSLLHGASVGHLCGFKRFLCGEALYLWNKTNIKKISSQIVKKRKLHVTVL